MKLAVVGATGEVGRMMLKCLEEQNILVSELYLYASARSQGQKLFFNNKEYTVQTLTKESMQQNYDFLLFSAGGKTALEYAPVAAQAGNTIIDNSSAFRQQAGIPLIVPEINGEVIKGYQGIIANPNCSTIQMVLPLNVLHQEFGLKKVIVSTYQSVSGAGHKGIDTLMAQRNGSEIIDPFSQKIDLNVLPQVDRMLDNGYCFEEEKMHFETRKILNIPDLLISATTVRVPVLYGHSETIYAEFAQDVDLAQAQKALQHSTSIKFYSDTIITPIDVVDSDDSHVCRLRMGVDNKSLNFWCVGNNVRLGAATNAVRILKYLIS